MASWKRIVTVLLVPAAQAGDFLEPWTAGPNGVYSNNQQLEVGTSIGLEWRLDGKRRYSLGLWQDRRPEGGLSNYAGIEGGWQISFIIIIAG